MCYLKIAISISIERERERENEEKHLWVQSWDLIHHHCYKLIYRISLIISLSLYFFIIFFFYRISCIYWNLENGFFNSTSFFSLSSILFANLLYRITWVLLYILVCRKKHHRMTLRNRQTRKEKNWSEKWMKFFSILLLLLLI